MTHTHGAHTCAWGTHMCVYIWGYTHVTHILAQTNRLAHTRVGCTQGPHSCRVHTPGTHVGPHIHGPHMGGAHTWGSHKGAHTCGWIKKMLNFFLCLSSLPPHGSCIPLFANQRKSQDLLQRIQNHSLILKGAWPPTFALLPHSSIEFNEPPPLDPLHTPRTLPQRWRPRETQRPPRCTVGQIRFD